MMDFLAKGTAVTGVSKASLLQKLREVDPRGAGCRPKASASNYIAQMEARSCGYDTLHPPPSSYDFAPSVFPLFPSIKSFLNGKRFQGDDALISETTSWLQRQRATFYLPGVHSCIKRQQITSDTSNKSTQLTLTD
nr:uncharacterized protein LOC113829348 [Penaeus vannamei]